MSNTFEYEKRTNCICGGALIESGRVVPKVFSWGEVRFLQCNTCGSWCQSPQILLSSLAQWFDSADYQGSTLTSGVAYVNYLADEQHRRTEAAARYNNDLQKYLPPGSRVVEFGCATGSLLSVLRERGCEVTGVDLSPTFVETARNTHGLNVLQGDLHQAPLPTHHFDAVLLMGTIGNLQDLPRCLERFRQLLKPGGLLIFNYVNADSFVPRYLYRSRFWMFTPSVNCFMSRRGASAVMTKSGFNVITDHTDRQQPSFQKLFNHAKLGFALPLLRSLGIAEASLPFGIPIPSVRLVMARKAG